MEGLHNLVDLNHRSRDRIKTLGEVFTPENYVESMLDTLSKGKRNFWSNENNVFFEPTSGHGNIVLSILQRRVEALYKKAISTKIKKPELYAVANSINTLWAIDIDSVNIEACRERVLKFITGFLLSVRKENSLEDLVDSEFDFFCHLLCGIKWHINENEALTALCSDEQKAQKSANQTKLSAKWFSKNNHKPIDFDYTWIAYFKECEFAKVKPLDFKRVEKYLENILNGSSKGQSHFKFSKTIFKFNFEFKGLLDLEVA